MQNPSTCDYECNKAQKVSEYLDIKNCSCEKRLVGKLVLECEDEILNTTETLFNDNKVASAKNNCLIYTISLLIICLLLLFVICVNSSYYYTKYQLKQLFNNISVKLGKTEYNKYIIKWRIITIKNIHILKIVHVIISMT